MMKKRQFITAEDGKQLKKKRKEIATVMNTPPPLLITFLQTNYSKSLDKNNDYMQTLQSGVISEAEMSSGIPRTSVSKPKYFYKN